MKIVVYDPSDAINYLGPIIITYCGNFARDLLPNLMRHGTDALLTVDFNTHIFSYTINGINPTPLISVRVDDSYSNPHILIDVPFVKANEEFYIRIDFEHKDTDFDKKIYRFKKTFVRSRWDKDTVIAPTDLKLPVFDNDAIKKLIDFNNEIGRIILNANGWIDMREKVDVIEDVDCEADEEIDEETPVEEPDETPEERPVYKMRRFAGMMPVNEIERTDMFKDKYGHTIRIDAGPNGWTVRYADMSSNYKDESIGTDANFKNAYDTVAASVGPLTPVSTKRKEKTKR